MPAVLALPAFWGAVGAGTAVVGSVYSANKQSSATRRAAGIQSRANTDAMAIERENEARRRQEFDTLQARAREQWDAEQAELRRQTDEDMRRFELTRASQFEDRALTRAAMERNEATDRYRYDAEQQRRDPYRAAGHAAVGVLSQRAGLPAPPPRAEYKPSPVPERLPPPSVPSFTPSQPPPQAPPPSAPPSSSQSAPDGRMLTQGEVADLTPEKLQELLKYGFKLPPMGSLIGQQPGVSRGY